MPHYSRLAMPAFLLASAALIATPARAQNAQGPSVERPCSFITAADMSTLIGARPTSAVDEHFRCKYTIGNGWLETKLMDIALKTTRDIYDYDKAHGKPVAGVGDQAYVLGATLVAKLGDVVVVVDGSNMPRPPDDAKLKAVALRIVSRIP
jgi:hypothetical protein